MDLLYPCEWHDHKTQADLLLAGLKAPIFTTGLENLYEGFSTKHKTVYVPFLGDDTIKNMWKMTGGNPLALEDREKLCLLVTPVIPGVSYDKVFYGHVNEDGTASKASLPSFFLRNVSQTIDYTMRAFSQLTQQSYQCLAAKLNPLMSGKANIVLYIKFSHFCEFDRQMYYTPSDVTVEPGYDIPKIRIIPKPYISKFGDPEKGYKISFEFHTGDKMIFTDMYNILQNFVEKDLGLHMRHIKSDNDNTCLRVFTQITDKTVKEFADKVKAFEKRNKNNYVPYCLKSIQYEEITV